MTDTRRQIVDAALALVADRGIGATSVDEIAAAAGVAKGSVFYNFGSKSGLFEAIIAEGVTRLTAALRAAGDGLQGRAALDAMLGALLEQVRAHPDFAKLVVAETFRSGRAWQESIRQVREESMGTLVSVIEQEWPERDARLTAAALFGAALVAGLEWLVFQPDRSLDEVRAAVLSTVR
ncbi:TetR family transcriptional regulator [Cellulomonas sp. A375-1]|nr:MULTISPECIES: TetR/AcrR family transcriptional regulator [Cellulomonas]KMM45598.1 TetR family transcriptional regulator [Cellulomonas sp. A375-1]MCR6703780.1 TetR/AcrR family transcriptional regulator [Cellulomonas sp.]GGL25786.1 TetR family transcriptional regulator [Cellulomonas gelida]